jgi:hypothetical protein
MCSTPQRAALLYDEDTGVYTADDKFWRRITDRVAACKTIKDTEKLV